MIDHATVMAAFHTMTGCIEVCLSGCIYLPSLVHRRGRFAQVLTTITMILFWTLLASSILVFLWNYPPSSTTTGSHPTLVAVALMMMAKTIFGLVLLLVGCFTVAILQGIWSEQQRINCRYLFFAFGSNGNDNDNDTNRSISISNSRCFRTCVALLLWGALLSILLLLLDWVDTDRRHNSTPIIIIIFLLESLLLLAGAYVVVWVRTPQPTNADGGALECDCDESRMSLL
jgi:hypothetical protein